MYQATDDSSQVYASVRGGSSPNDGWSTESTHGLEASTNHFDHDYATCDRSHAYITNESTQEDQYDPYQLRPKGTDLDLKSGDEGWEKDSRRPLGSILVSILIGWWAEVAWLFVSIGSLIALVVVLDKVDNKPLPDWPSGITLNTVVALLSTISRSAFVGPVMEAVAQAKWLWFNKRERPLRDYASFDKASRGPAGSLQLLLTSRARAIGFLPALLIISALATATITQSAITYPQRPVALPGDGGATLKKSSEYWWLTANMYAQSRRKEKLNRAVHQGVYMPRTEELIYGSPSCRSSNCTWDEFSTLQLCVDVKNVTEHMTVEELDGVQAANMSLSNNIWGLRPTGFGAVKVQTGDTIAYGDVDKDLKNARVASLFVMNLRPVYGQVTYRAYESYFYMCVNTYKVRVTNNVPETKVIHSSVTNAQGEVFIKYMNSTLPATYLTTPRDPGVKYPMSGMANISIADALTYSLGGMVSTGVAPQYYNATAAIASRLDPSELVEHGINNTISEEQDQGEYEAMLNVTRVIASALSAVMLDTEVNGTALAMETYVRVRWEWLSLLVAQVALSVIVLLSIIIATARSGVGILKTDSLSALVAIPVDERVAMAGDPASRARLEAEGVPRITATGVLDGDRGLRRRGSRWQVQ